MAKSKHLAALQPEATDSLSPREEVSADSNSRWYVFRSLPRLEATAEANLRNQNIRVFLPKVLVTTRRARKFVSSPQWLFPRYGFVRLDLSRERWRNVNGTLGVERLVMRGDEPHPVPTGVVENIAQYVGEDGLIDFNQGLLPGAVVRVKAGPLTGAVGILQQLDAKGRVNVLLEIMTGSIRTQLARELIERIEG